jgi:hypothetical protein
MVEVLLFLPVSFNSFEAEKVVLGNLKASFNQFRATVVAKSMREIVSGKNDPF